jgi:hypothetical protein
MDPNSTMELYKRGKEEWNKWANKTLDDRDKKKENWPSEATADFSLLTEIKGKIDFRGFIFPGDTIFEKVHFNGRVSFERAIFYGEVFLAGSSFEEDAIFNEAIFLSTAWFSHFKRSKEFDSSDFYAKFKKRSYFNKAIFAKESWFSHVLFNDDVQFINSMFVEWARFDDLQCKSSAQFDQAQFLKRKGPSINGQPHEGGAWFVGARFSGQAWYKKTIFIDDVSFQGAIFENDAIFDSTIFRSSAIFKGMISNRMFALSASEFAITPDFIQTHFTEAPIFDDVKIFDNESQFFKRLVLKRLMRKASRKLKGNSKEQLMLNRRNNDSAKWRALRRLAVQGHDHDKEREFFSGEIWATPVNSFRFWFGGVYWIFSAHGRSIVRPFIFWCLLTFVCFVFYLCQSPQMGFHKLFRIALIERDFSQLSSVSCLSSDSCIGQPGYKGISNLTKEALNLSLRNSLFNIESFGESQQITLTCLYGSMKHQIDISKVEYIPTVPRIVSYVIVIQRLFATLYVFLFGFAIRNMLRVK